MTRLDIILLMREDDANTVPYAAKVDFYFLTPNGINMPDWPSLAIFYNTHGINNNSECLCVGAPHRHYKDFRRAFEK